MSHNQVIKMSLFVPSGSGSATEASELPFRGRNCYGHCLVNLRD